MANGLPDPESTSGAALRAAAAKAAQGVDQGRSLDATLAEQTGRVKPRDLALLAELTYGVVRHRRRLDAIIDALLDRPLSKKSGTLRALLRVGIYQLDALRLPDHAAVHATVAACDRIGARRARGLANAVLRRFLREGIPEDIDDNPAVANSHPDWLVRTLQEDWPQHWQALLAANNQRAPMTLRVALDRKTREAALTELNDADLPASPHVVIPSALRLESAAPVDRINGFGEGWLSVQDAAAQLAVTLLAPQTGEQILDACAAPGGKTGHLLEAADMQVTAVDIDDQRLARVAENLSRLDRKAALIAADAAALDSDQQFDAILLDAPCSGTGVIRRHPDIKWLRRESDIDELARRQGELLRALWPRLRPGGRLLYAVCSVLAAEGETVVSAFCQDESDALIRRIEPGCGEATAHGRRIPTGEMDMDGFYFALLERRPERHLQRHGA